MSAADSASDQSRHLWHGKAAASVWPTAGPSCWRIIHPVKVESLLWLDAWRRCLRCTGLIWLGCCYTSAIIRHDCLRSVTLMCHPPCPCAVIPPTSSLPSHPVLHLSPPAPPATLSVCPSAYVTGSVGWLQEYHPVPAGRWIPHYSWRHFSMDLWVRAGSVLEVMSSSSSAETPQGKKNTLRSITPDVALTWYKLKKALTLNCWWLFVLKILGALDLSNI